MSERQSAWREALKEPNAIGWIGLMVVVLVIGIGVFYFGNSNPPSSGQVTTGQAPK